MFDSNVQRVMDRVDALRNQVDDHWQIPRDEALLLAQLVRLGRCQSICEIGVSYGYSTLHLAAAASETGGHVHGFEMDPRKIEAAAAHLKEAGLAEFVALHPGDARETVAAFTPDKPYDFAFIDAEKPESQAYLQALMPKLTSSCALVTDNTTTHADELQTFVNTLRQLSGARSCGVDVGNGFELTLIQMGA